MSRNQVTGIILAGGAGRRMQSQDKAQVKYQGKPLIEHVINTIDPQVDQLIISYSRNEERYQALPYATRRDDEPFFNGPLSGVVSCADLINTDRVFVVPCDMPKLPLDIVARLGEALKDSDLAIAHDGNRNQHLVFLAELHIIDSITVYLESGQKSVASWVALQKPSVINFSAEAALFLNINTDARLSGGQQDAVSSFNVKQ